MKNVFLLLLSSCILCFSADVPYGGGPVMTGTPTNYIIWYGLHWEDSPAVPIITKFIQDFSGSSWMNTVTGYYQADGRSVTGKMEYGGSTTDLISRGGSLRWNDISHVVSGAIESGKLPLDPNGIYHVLTSWEVAVEGFKFDICGRHGSFYMGDKLIKYEFTGDAGNVMNCQPMGLGPNGNSGADGMINVIAHEIAETLTDPCADTPGCPLGWADEQRGETADLCAWHYGPVYRAANGNWANTNIKGVDYLIQQNWVNGAGCVSSWGSPIGQIHLENLTNPDSMVFHPGDGFRILVHTEPGSPVYIYAHGPNALNLSFTLGVTDQSGDLILSGAVDRTLIGDWTEEFRTGDTTISKTLFSIVP